MTTKKQHWDGMYGLPLDQIPWEITDPPRELVQLIESNSLPKGAALDVACGTGNYSLYLAKNGYCVTGVDFSPKAIAIAQAHAVSLPVTFKVGDATRLADAVTPETFDFILDYSLLHHIAPGEVAGYAQQFSNLLKPGGRLLMVCYSDKDERAQAGQATGKYGNDMFFRSRAEIEQLYEGLIVVGYAETTLGKRGQHPAHSFLFSSPAS